MISFKRSGRDGGGGKKFGRKDFGKRGFGKPAMHKAVCDECGNLCEVPFKPSNDRPVFCNNCFKKDGNPNLKRSGEKNYRDRDFDRDSRPGMHKATCDECGNTCEVPFRPSNDKPVFCNNCFKKDGNAGNKNTEQFEILNMKLDRILKMLTSPPKETVEEQAVVKKVKTPKAKKEKA
jgi:CxxC-x17-CxxC domain-containing protein